MSGFSDKSQCPGEGTILEVLGPVKALWLDIREYLQTQYDSVPEACFFTKNCGRSFRHRKGRKTLCCLFPDTGSFTCLIVLGKDEVRKAEQAKGQLSEAAGTVLDNTGQLHDGRWLWMRATNADDVRPIELLLAAKRKPKQEGMRS